MPEDRHSGTPGGNGSGADVKSGTTGLIVCGTQQQIVFGTAFASIPTVVVTIDGNVTVNDWARAASVTATDFWVSLYKGHGGSTHNWAVHWIATDAGDP